MLKWFKLRKQKAPPLIQDFESAKRPDPATPIDHCPLLVLDLELTGLNPERDHIVSIGWVPVRERAIILAEARHYLVEIPTSVGQSASFHGLHDRDLKNARGLAEVLAELLQNYAGYVFAAHNAPLDASFLRAALTRSYGQAPELLFIDTLQIERKRMTRRGLVFKDDGLRLGSCLQRHKLPGANSHNALEDAFSCALLLLAQISQTNRAQALLADLLRDSR